jgi:nitronate monooxygenase
VRRALAQFPIRGVAERILDCFFLPGGKSDDEPFRAKPIPAARPGRMLEDLLVAGNFVEVFLAKEGHTGRVGINYLEKIQVPTLPSLYGAMLAGVDWILMGAGIPKSIPGILDRFARTESASLKLDAVGTLAGEEFCTEFVPQAYSGEDLTPLARPKFAAIISAATLATMLVKRATGRVDGFVVEGPVAGGHNAPPRGPLQLNDRGEPIYGERDVCDLAVMRAIGLPFWLAGGYGTPDGLKRALEGGAAGIQVGTAFAYCEESGLHPDLKEQVLRASLAGEAHVFTDPVASPTGFPFKVVQLEGTLSDRPVYEDRQRICDLGYLRQPYRTETGTLGWRCPAEPVEDYLRKGGQLAETRGRKCLCNALMANIDLGQVQTDGTREKPLLTSGDDVAEVARFLRPGTMSYHARDVINCLLRRESEPEELVECGADHTAAQI